MPVSTGSRSPYPYLMPKKHTSTVLIIGLVLLSGLAAPVAAQEGNSSSAPMNNSSSPSSAPTVAGDSKTHIVDYWMQDGSMHVELHAERVVRVSISAPPSSSASQAGGYVQQALLQTGETRTVSLRAPTSEVWVSTTRSVEAGRFTRLSLSDGGLVPGVASAEDVFYGAAGAAGAVALSVLQGVYSWRAGDDGGERVA